MSVVALGAHLCECIGCKRLFVGVATFEKHRRGEHGIREGPTRRRCATDEEMRELGLGQDERGVWVDAANRARNADALAALAARRRVGARRDGQRGPGRARVGTDATLGVEAPIGPRGRRAA